MKTCSPLPLLGTGLVASADDGDKGKGKGKGRGAVGDPAAMFKRLDVNHDGKLSKEEFAKLRDNLPAKVKEKTSGKGNGQFSGKFFDLADTNKDGYLSLDEFKKCVRRWPNA